jgi:hypothetical protein
MKLSETELNEKLIERFFNSIDESESVEKCWNWTKLKKEKGYGLISYSSSASQNYYREAAHRFSYRMHYGEVIPKGIFVCHKCDNPKCVNPFHLFLGTNYDNVQDMVRKGRGSKGEKHSKTLQQAAKLGLYNTNVKLKKEDVFKIIELRKQGLTYKAIGEMFGVDYSNIYKITKGKRWQYLLSGEQ